MTLKARQRGTCASHPRQLPSGTDMDTGDAEVSSYKVLLFKIWLTEPSSNVTLADCQHVQQELLSKGSKYAGAIQLMLKAAAENQGSNLEVLMLLVKACLLKGDNVNAIRYGRCSSPRQVFFQSHC